MVLQIRQHNPSIIYKLANITRTQSESHFLVVLFAPFIYNIPIQNCQPFFYKIYHQRVRSISVGEFLKPTRESRCQGTATMLGPVSLSSIPKTLSSVEGASILVFTLTLSPLYTKLHTTTYNTKNHTFYKDLKTTNLPVFVQLKPFTLYCKKF